MTFRYQEFLSPGTWTNPGTVTSVRVTVVGGGGGASANVPSISPFQGAGGGGAVVTRWVPVSGPVPVTVGAGGTGSPSWPSTTPGGNSFFGPAGPGPVPAIPTTTVAAGGGAKAGEDVPVPSIPIGGGAGCGNLPDFFKQGGAYGHNSISDDSGGAGGKNALTVTAGGNNYVFSIGEGYFGNGGSTAPGGLILHGSPINTPGSRPLSPTLNTNTGAGGSAQNGPNTDSPGSAGIVIVRWFE